MTEQQWRIRVDRDACISAGKCVGIAPRHFTLVDERSSPTTEPVAPDDAVLKAADFCPAEAIVVRAVDTGEIVRPEW